MKENTKTAFALGGAGLGILAASILLVVVLLVTGLLNAAFSLWQGIPTLALYVSCGLAALLLVLWAFRSQDFAEVFTLAESAIFAAWAVGGCALLALVLRIFFASWFSNGGTAWYKLGFTAVGTAMLGTAMVFVACLFVEEKRLSCQSMLRQ